MRNRSHINSQFFTDHQLSTNKPKKILRTEEVLAPSNNSSYQTAT